MSANEGVPVREAVQAVLVRETTSAVPVDGAARRAFTRRSLRALALALTVGTILTVLFAVPWWTLLAAGTRWPGDVASLGTLLVVAVGATFPVLMVAGHGRRQWDPAARVADTVLGVAGVLFIWSLPGNVLRGALAVADVVDPLRSRIVAVTVLAVALPLLLWGYAEAMRVPRVRRVDVTLARLGAGLDGTRVVVLTDTHYGPIDRTRWSARVIDEVNALDADIVCHTGDIADGTVARRRGQAARLGAVRARLARAYVTGNHEYLGNAQGWLDHMRRLGWQPLHNQHIVVERDGDRLVIAGVDDATARFSAEPGHRADFAAALGGADPDLPVLLLAHQPKQVGGAVEHGVDLQVSGHTHGGQIWPLSYLVRLDQPAVHGLSRHGPRTQLYTSRGAGFWGPPFRIFAPSEITVLTLRARGATRGVAEM